MLVFLCNKSLIKINYVSISCFISTRKKNTHLIMTNTFYLVDENVYMNSLLLKIINFIKST